MPANTDHNRRDAQDGARAEIRVILNRYRRRMEEHAKALIAQELEEAERDGQPRDWTHVGRYAATDAAAFYGAGPPAAAIEHGRDALTAGSDRTAAAA